MHTEARGFEELGKRRDDLTEEDLGSVPDSVLRWMARHAKGNDLAMLGGVLSDRRFNTH
jgi:hypothetical protein